MEEEAQARGFRLPRKGRGNIRQAIMVRMQTQRQSGGLKALHTGLSARPLPPKKKKKAAFHGRKVAKKASPEDAVVSCGGRLAVFVVCVRAVFFMKRCCHGWASACVIFMD